MKPRKADLPTGDVCGTCGGSACLHSPHYASNYDQSNSKCDIGNLCSKQDSNLLANIIDKVTTYDEYFELMILFFVI